MYDQIDRVPEDQEVSYFNGQCPCCREMQRLKEQMARCPVSEGSTWLNMHAAKFPNVQTTNWSTGQRAGFSEVQGSNWPAGVAAKCPVCQVISWPAVHANGCPAIHAAYSPSGQMPGSQTANRSDGHGVVNAIDQWTNWSPNGHLTGCPCGKDNVARSTGGQMIAPPLTSAIRCSCGQQIPATKRQLVRCPCGEIVNPLGGQVHNNVAQDSAGQEQNNPKVSKKESYNRKGFSPVDVPRVYSCVIGPLDEDSDAEKEDSFENEENDLGGASAEDNRLLFDSTQNDDTTLNYVKTLQCVECQDNLHQAGYNLKLFPRKCFRNLKERSRISNAGVLLYCIPVDASQVANKQETCRKDTSNKKTKTHCFTTLCESGTPKQEPAPRYMYKTVTFETVEEGYQPNLAEIQRNCQTSDNAMYNRTQRKDSIPSIQSNYGMCPGSQFGQNSKAQSEMDMRILN
ncbi:hypothetical protein Bpfe_000224 [Biomphalaria pfeifferi]|uniref:Uncharacterized protein n=1 Tax=Biomphalaria pfeifferi TaxID=112525 RepID=A0AAD8CC42_BIOPF|nr:hypothetical protein Bpfe_000224 [Biomphalaria pfeifferi]